jgi:seryl-tRNA synthetase
LLGGAEELRGRLVQAGLLIPTGVEGLYGRSETYESIVDALGKVVHRLGEGEPVEVVNFPPVEARDAFEKTSYLESFPNLVGAVRGFSGSGRDHQRLLRAFAAGEDWSEQFEGTDIVMSPAACHPVYPMCAGRLPPGGRRFEVAGQCFRREPSLDPARMQVFRMHEQVYVGEPGTALRHRDRWVELARTALGDLGLEVTAELANDPFFGRTGELLADLQRKEARKIEIVMLLPGYPAPTAMASGNWHQDHFGSQFRIETANGEVAHSSCFGFGLDRIALALLATYGLDPVGWPAIVRAALWG